jgi:SAM-dependent methyltransferase
MNRLKVAVGARSPHHRSSPGADVAMHPSSLDNMQRCYDRYIKAGPLGRRDRVTVLDMGGADVNGSYRQIFSDKRFDYSATDLTPGEGVNIVLDDPYHVPLPDGSVDVVISGQTLEHCEFFWLTFAEMVRLLKPDGFIFLIAPSQGPEYRFPVDCYRFYPDAYRALAKWANCDLVEVWRDDRDLWRDLVGVFQHSAKSSTAPSSASFAAKLLDVRRHPRRLAARLRRLLSK